MKKILKHTATLCGLAIMLPAAVTAQVDKRVVVTKDYRPTVSESVKLPVAPDMTDTVKMRPEISYDIKPVMYPTDLSTTRFRPASVTYWEFNRPTNFYLKLGAGYPINALADFYASMHDFRTGYIMASANHVGQYGNMKNYFGDKRNSLQAKTKASVAGGVYWGKRMFEGSVAYRSDVDRRYAAPLLTMPDDMTAEYEDFGLKLRLGDDFADLSRVNFNVALHGDFFHDKSDYIAAERPKLQQFNFGGEGRVARRFGKHYVELAAGYDGYRGTKSLKGYKDDVVKVGARYGLNVRVLDLLVGLDYCFDRVAGRDKASNYLLPFARLHFNVTHNNSVIPFVEVDGSHRNNSYYSLAVENPYIYFAGIDDVSKMPNTVSYNARAGIEGKFARERFGYRVSAGLSYFENALYWYSYDYAWMRAAYSGQTLVALNAELDYRPLSELLVSAGVHGRIYINDAPAEFFGCSAEANGRSPLDAYVKVRYTHRKFSVGGYADMRLRTRWLIMGDPQIVDGWKDFSEFSDFRSPTVVDLGVEAEYKIKEECSVFAAGSNLANAKIYYTPLYREQGIRFTVGVKLVF